MGNNSRFFFILIAAGASLGIGSIWAYPYFSFTLSGLFFIPYLIAVLLLGMPLLMLEFSVGQFFDKNIVDLFSSVRKRFTYVGWLMLFNSLIVMSVYGVVLAWHIIYLFASFGIKWKEDAKGYFFSNVLQASENFHGFTQFSLAVFIALIIAWLAVFIYIRKGFESMKRGFLFTIPALIVLMLFFLAYSLKLEHALGGVYLFLKPSIGNLLSLNAWISAFSLAALSLGLSFGVMHAIARKTKGFIAGTSLIIVLLELIAGIAIGFIVFGILGFLSFRIGAGIYNTSFFDSSFPFTALAQALPFFRHSIFISLLFFLFLSLFVILGISALAYSLSHVLVHKFKTKHFNAAVIVCGFGFLFGLAFITKPGFYILDIASHFVYYNILIALALEVIAIGWFFDAEKIAQYINQNSNLKIGIIWKFLVRYFVPVILAALFFFQLKSDILTGYKGYAWIYLLIFGAGTVIAPLVLAAFMPQRIFDRK